MHLCHVIAFFLWCVYPLIFPLLIVTVIVAEAKCEPQLLISAISAAYVTVAGFTTLRGTGNSLRIPSYKWVRPIQSRPFLAAVLHKPLTAYFVEKIEIIRWKLYVLFAHLRWSKNCLLARFPPRPTPHQGLGPQLCGLLSCSFGFSLCINPGSALFVYNQMLNQKLGPKSQDIMKITLQSCSRPRMKSQSRVTKNHYIMTFKFPHSRGG